MTIDTNPDSGIDPYGFAKDGDLLKPISVRVRFAVVTWPCDLTTGLNIDAVRYIAGLRIERRTNIGIVLWTVDGRGLRASSVSRFDIVDVVRDAERSGRLGTTGDDR